ncbi:tyrosine-type recombinase/integrase [Ruegeria sp. HKCCD8929]|uniref:tyrosine-type recombinase/integrase n=1 Tax=Ruegeria sp. HKCCD8929 TaxID=2683006 RepID=UPI001487BF35|nr:tyrosine-type recombinase/integrase [Ruegeria sp. HKCCD8929]
MKISSEPQIAFSRLSAEGLRAINKLLAGVSSDHTRRAYTRDLMYLTAWKRLRFDADLAWPESQDVVLAFVQDHTIDLVGRPKTDRAVATATTLIEHGLRRSLARPAPTTLNRCLAAWRTFHRLRNLEDPFGTPSVRQARAEARRLVTRHANSKSAHPITRDVLEILLSTCTDSRRGSRDRAILMLGWASGGRRRSEIVSLRREDVDLKDFEQNDLIWLSPPDTRIGDASPQLVLKGRAARALVQWIEIGEIEDGPLFRPISKADRVLPRQLSPDAIYQIVKRRLKLAGLPGDYATPHGLRSGFLTQAALDGTPIQAAIQLSRHQTLAQAQRYYADVEMADNPATDLLE